MPSAFVLELHLGSIPAATASWRTTTRSAVCTLNFLYEDNHLLVVDKPAGIATMGSAHGQPTVAREAAAYLKQRYHKPGNVYVGIVSRLDRLVSGVLVLAKTSKAASRLSEQIRRQEFEKRYVAVVEGNLEFTTDGSWHEFVDLLVKDETAHRVRVCQHGLSRGAKEARLLASVLEQLPGASLIAIELLTGRKHQIRVQLAARGHAIWGDQKYGAYRKFAPGIALHCYQLNVTHPTTKDRLTFRAEVPAGWSQLPSQLAQAASLTNLPEKGDSH